MSNLPCGVWLLEKIGCGAAHHTSKRKAWFRFSIFILTFVTYAAFHCSRKPISVVKNVLNLNCTGLVPPPDVNVTDNPRWCDWSPFDGEDSNTLLGFLDSAYLFTYAFFMFFSGVVAERMDLRYFLVIGMLLSGLFTCAFGFAYFLQIHNIVYFLAVQVLCGVVQASGWPGVVTVMGNWNSKSKRGLIFGVWNSHTSVGNILGSLMASAFVDDMWGMSFILPGLFISAVALINFLFLCPYPTEVGCNPPGHHHHHHQHHHENGDALEASGESSESEDEETDGLKIWSADGRDSPEGYGSIEDDYRRVRSNSATEDEIAGLLDEPRLLEEEDEEEGGSNVVVSVASRADVVSARKDSASGTQPDSEKAISFFKAIRIPGVLPFSICLFFAKLVSYAFLYWLPRYLHSAANYSPSESANLSTLFDFGGIVGGILAGMLNDWTGAPGIVCVLLLLVAIPMMFLYQAVATTSHVLNTVMLLAVGLLVNGPYALITTAVSADLGTSLRGNSKALATVTAIIDGTGSVGAALGPLLAGAASSGGNWTGVFIILMFSDAIAILSLGWVVSHEIHAIRERRRQRLTGEPSGATGSS